MTLDLSHDLTGVNRECLLTKLPDQATALREPDPYLGPKGSHLMYLEHLSTVLQRYYMVPYGKTSYTFIEEATTRSECNKT